LGKKIILFYSANQNFNINFLDTKKYRFSEIIKLLKLLIKILIVQKFLLKLQKTTTIEKLEEINNAGNFRWL